MEAVKTYPGRVFNGRFIPDDASLLNFFAALDAVENEPITDDDIKMLENNPVSFRKELDGNEIKNTKSPLEGIKGVDANVTTDELIDVIREGREGREYFV